MMQVPAGEHLDPDEPLSAAPVKSTSSIESLVPSLSTTTHLEVLQPGKQDGLLSRRPRRFKSGFIIYSAARHKEIKQQLLEQGKVEQVSTLHSYCIGLWSNQLMQTTTIAKLLSKEWHGMTEEQRAEWNDLSNQDKERYDEEMKQFKKTTRRKDRRKDPNAPKRPMSAFLAFSNERRGALKKEYPEASNADLSRMLAKMWKEAPSVFKAPFIEKEKELRERYKTAIAIFRQNRANQARRNAKKSAAANQDPTPQIASDTFMVVEASTLQRVKSSSANAALAQRTESLLLQAQQIQPRPIDLMNSRIAPTPSMRTEQSSAVILRGLQQEPIDQMMRMSTGYLSHPTLQLPLMEPPPSQRHSLSSLGSFSSQQSTLPFENLRASQVFPNRQGLLGQVVTLPNQGFQQPAQLNDQQTLDDEDQQSHQFSGLFEGV